MSFPDPVRHYLSSSLVEIRHPFCVHLDPEKRVLNWWGDEFLYISHAPEKGEHLNEVVGYLQGMDLAKPIQLPFVHLNDNIVAHLHVLPEKDTTYLLFLDAREDLKAQQSLQQQANETNLLMEKQQRLLNELIEAKTALNIRQNELENINREQSQFIASMSHEFRTPLTAVVGYADALFAGAGTDQEVANQSRSIQRNAHHLLMLVDNLMEQARLDRDAKPVFCGLSVRAMADDVASILAPLSAEKGIAFAVYVDEDVPEVVMTDEIRVRQVLINLLGNAVKFTERGEVKLNVTFADDTLTMKVTDTGPGIEGADQSSIFRAFVQTYQDRPRAGVGLGLHITMRIIKLLEGKLILKSTIGEGSEFVVTIPVTVASEDDLVDTIVEVHENAPRVLVADDNIDIRELIEMMLARAGFETLVAVDGKEAIDMALAEQPDLVIMDLNMPKQNGFKAAKALRQAGFENPMVALSAARSDKDRKKAIESGFNDFSTKPLQMSDLLEKLERFIVRNSN